MERTADEIGEDNLNKAMAATREADLNEVEQLVENVEQYWLHILWGVLIWAGLFYLALHKWGWLLW